jgi:hypothetical protein
MRLEPKDLSDEPELLDLDVAREADGLPTRRSLDGRAR